MPGRRTPGPRRPARERHIRQSSRVRASRDQHHHPAAVGVTGTIAHHALRAGKRGLPTSSSRPRSCSASVLYLQGWSTPTRTRTRPAARHGHLRLTFFSSRAPRLHGRGRHHDGVHWLSTMKGHFTPDRHSLSRGWHGTGTLVDVVWLGLFIFVYGSDRFARIHRRALVQVTV